MGRPRSPDPKVHVSIIKVKRKADDFYDVYEQYSVYDPEIKNSRNLGRKKIGILPHDYTDPEKDLIKGVDKRTRKGREALAGGNIELLKSRKARRTGPAAFPLPYVLLVLVLASWSECKTERQIADFWQKNKAGLKRWFADFPDGDVYPDTVHRFVSFVGRMRRAQLHPQFKEFMSERFAQRHDASGGETPKAASAEKNKASYRFDCIDSNQGLTLRMLGSEYESPGKISRSSPFESFNLNGCVAISDCVESPKDFEELLCSKECDYLMTIKNRAEIFGQEFASILENTAKTAEKAQKADFPVWLGVQEETFDLGNWRSEKRTTQVVPAFLFINDAETDFFENWGRTENGCAARVTSEITDKKTGEISRSVRYCVSTLYFDKKYIAARISRLINDYQPAENGLHRVLDIAFGEDRSQCLNYEYTEGKASISRFAFLLLNKVSNLAEERSRETIQFSDLKARVKDLDEALTALEPLLCGSDALFSGIIF